MASDLKRASNGSVSDRSGQCRATTRSGEACRRKAVDGDRLCQVHNGSQDMRALGRMGGRAIPKARRQDAERESARDHLRRELDPSEITQAIKAGLASPNERDRLAAAKVALGELYEPAAERRREEEIDVAAERARFASRIDDLAARRALTVLVERGLIRPAGGRAFAGVVMFDLRELAEWVAAWVPRPVIVTDIACGVCGKAGVRLVAEGEALVSGDLYCGVCEATSSPRSATYDPALSMP